MLECFKVKYWLWGIFYGCKWNEFIYKDIKIRAVYQNGINIFKSSTIRCCEYKSLSVEILKDSRNCKWKRLNKRLNKSKKIVFNERHHGWFWEIKTSNTWNY